MITQNSISNEVTHPLIQESSIKHPQPSRASENTQVSPAVTPHRQKLKNQGEPMREDYRKNYMTGGFATKGAPS